MENKEKYLEFYPGNWLYNAGVIGFLQSLENVEKKNILEYISDDGKIIIPLGVFNDLKIDERYFSQNGITSIYRNRFFQNYLNSDEDINKFPAYIKSLAYVSKGGDTCSICGSGYVLPDKKIVALRKIGLDKFLDRISNLNIIFNKKIAPLIYEILNTQGIMNSGLKICPVCSFLLIHHLLPFTLVGNSILFINAPSFRLMYELNKILKNLSNKENLSCKNLLAMSVMDFFSKVTITTGLRASMNIEMVNIKRAKESATNELVKLPDEIIRILSNKKIAELLSNMDELKILNMVIDGRWKDLAELGNRILKISMMPSMGIEEQNFINDCFYKNENRDIKNLKALANRLLNLYALIEEQVKFKRH